MMILTKFRGGLRRLTTVAAQTRAASNLGGGMDASATQDPWFYVFLATITCIGTVAFLGGSINDLRSEFLNHNTMVSGELRAMDTKLWTDLRAMDTKLYTDRRIVSDDLRAMQAKLSNDLRSMQTSIQRLDDKVEKINASLTQLVRKSA